MSNWRISVSANIWATESRPPKSIPRRRRRRRRCPRGRRRLRCRVRNRETTITMALLVVKRATMWPPILLVWCATDLHASMSPSHRRCRLIPRYRIRSKAKRTELRPRLPCHLIIVISARNVRVHAPRARTVTCQPPFNMIPHQNGSLWPYLNNMRTRALTAGRTQSHQRRRRHPSHRLDLSPPARVNRTCSPVFRTAKDRCRCRECRAGVAPKDRWLPPPVPRRRCRARGRSLAARPVPPVQAMAVNFTTYRVFPQHIANRVAPRPLRTTRAGDAPRQ